MKPEQKLLNFTKKRKLTSEFQDIIRHEINKIHDLYPHLKYQELVQCNCQKCNGSQESHFYKLTTLRKRLKDSRETIECENSYAIVNIRTLIDDRTPKLHQLNSKLEFPEQVEDIDGIIPNTQALNSTQKVMEQLQSKDIDIMVNIMTDLAFESIDGHHVVFKNWLTRMDMPKNWIQSYGKFSSDTRIAASELVRSLYSRGINNENPDFNTLGSLLQVLLDEVGFDKASIIAVVMVRYKLIQNENLLNELIIKYQVPLTSEKN
jgi:hypothetical protein